MMSGFSTGVVTYGTLRRLPVSGDIYMTKHLTTAMTSTYRSCIGAEVPTITDTTLPDDRSLTSSHLKLEEIISTTAQKLPARERTGGSRRTSEKGS